MIETYQAYVQLSKRSHQVYFEKDYVTGILIAHTILPGNFAKHFKYKLIKKYHVQVCVVLFKWTYYIVM